MCRPGVSPNKQVSAFEQGGGGTHGEQARPIAQIRVRLQRPSCLDVVGTAHHHDAPALVEEPCDEGSPVSGRPPFRRRAGSQMHRQERCLRPKTTRVQPIGIDIRIRNRRS